MGVVWKAWDTELRRWVALKQIRGGSGDRDAVERVLGEARLAAPPINSPSGCSCAPVPRGGPILGRRASRAGDCSASALADVPCGFP